MVALERTSWRPGPDWKPARVGIDELSCPTTSLECQREFLDHFKAVDWASTELGPFENWPSVMREYLFMAMQNPAPVLLCLGKELRMVYNYPYSCSIGAKQWKILGMKYDEAWDEVWDSIAPFVKAGYEGKVTHVESTQMFLRLGEAADLEVAYFSWSMIPMLDGDNQVVGLYIPNTDTTKSILARRRFSVLSELGQSIADAASFREFWEGVTRGLCTDQARADVPALAIYSAIGSDMDEDLHTRPGEAWPVSKEARFAQIRRRGSEKTEKSEAIDKFRLVTNVPPHSRLPKDIEVPLNAVGSHGELDEEASGADILYRALVRLRQGDNFVVERGKRARTLFHNQRCVFGDEVKECVIMSIKSTHDEPVESLVLFAINTRLKLDSDYERYLSLIATNISAGLATVKLFANRLDQAQYRAWLTVQQSNELREALERRTRELLSAEARFTTVAGMLPSGLWLADAEGQLVYVNQAWHDISGHPASKPMSEFMEAVHEDDRDLCVQTWIDVTTGAVDAKTIVFRWKGKTKEGLERWSTSRAVVQRDQSGKITGVIGIIDDVSQQKHLELVEKLRADDAIQRRIRLNRFIDQLSHEIRNPMGAISSCVELVSERINERLSSEDASVFLRECLEDMGTISFCLQHMKRLVEETLSVSKIEHDFLTLSMEPFEPVSLVAKTVKMYEADMTSKGITCRIENDEWLTDIWLSSDHARIMQVCINFLTNAIKATMRKGPGDRSIVIRLRAHNKRPDGPQYTRTRGQEMADRLDALERPTSGTPEPMVNGADGHDNRQSIFLEIGVSDTGDGMDDEQVQKLFQRWSRTMPRTSVSYGVKGHGLGLYISRRIAHVLGGECGLLSEVGKGSTFSFYVKADVCDPPVTEIHRRPSLEVTAKSVSGLSIHDKGSPIPSDTGRRASIASAASGISAAISAGASTAATSPDEPRHVILVEDNLVNQKLLAKQLARRNFTVTTADNGALCVDALLKLANEGRYPVLCAMDVEMPVMNGLEATRKIRELEAAGALPGPLPILGVTANVRAEQVQEMHDAGMNDFLSKPFKIDDVVTRIDTLLVNA